MDTRTDDEYLIDRVKKVACNKSLQELISRHVGICKKIYSEYYPVLSERGVHPENFETEKDYIIYEAALTFNPKKAKFVSWVGLITRYYCLNQLKINDKTTVLENVKVFDFLENKCSLLGKIDMDLRDYILNILGRLKDKRIQLIYQMRYFDNPKKNTAWREIAKSLNISIQTAINLHGSVHKLLKEKLTSKEISDII